MGLFDKLKKLVSDDSSEAGAIEIIAPLSGEIVNIEDVPDVVFAEKIVGDGIAIKPSGNKMVAPVNGTIGKSSKLTTLSLLSLKTASSFSFTSVSIQLSLKVKASLESLKKAKLLKLAILSSSSI